jgi:hypothetical protein
MTLAHRLWLPLLVISLHNAFSRLTLASEIGTYGTPRGALGSLHSSEAEIFGPWYHFRGLHSSNGEASGFLALRGEYLEQCTK